jgi:hypothetical protein
MTTGYRFGMQLATVELRSTGPFDALRLLRQALGGGCPPHGSCPFRTDLSTALKGGYWFSLGNFNFLVDQLFIGFVGACEFE